MPPDRRLRAMTRRDPAMSLRQTEDSTAPAAGKAWSAGSPANVRLLFGQAAPLSCSRRSATQLLGQHLFVVQEVREPFPDVARFIEMSGHAVGATADRKSLAAEIRHDREHALVGDVVADKDRTAAF